MLCMVCERSVSSVGEEGVAQHAFGEVSGDISLGGVRNGRGRGGHDSRGRVVDEDGAGLEGHS